MTDAEILDRIQAAMNNYWQDIKDPAQNGIAEKRALGWIRLLLSMRLDVPAQS